MSCKPTGIAIFLWAMVALLAAILWALGTALLLLVLGAGSLLALAGLDYRRGRTMIRRLDVGLPDRVTLFRNRPDAIVITVENSAGLACELEVALDLPAALEAESETLRQRLNPEGPMGRVDYPCVARERGRYVVDGVYFALESPLRLWRVMRHQPGVMRVQVYPDLRAEQKRLAGFFLRRNRSGLREQRQLGKGREFEQLREYQSGDSYEDIHWKATARRARPITKMYQLERTQELYIIIDQSRLSARTVRDASGTTPYNATHLERYIMAAQLLAQVAEQQGDRVGLAAFSDQVTRFVRAGSGPSHYKACREAVFDLQPRLENPDFEELFTFLRLRLHKRALLIFLTHLDDPLFAEQFSAHAPVLSTHHLVLVAMLNPEHIRSLTQTGPVRQLEAAYDALSGHMQWRGLLEIQRELKHRGISLGMMHHRNLSLELIEQYMRVKKRQLL